MSQTDRGEMIPTLAYLHSYHKKPSFTQTYLITEHVYFGCEGSSLATLLVSCVFTQNSCDLGHYTDLSVFAVVISLLLGLNDRLQR